VYQYPELQLLAFGFCHFTMIDQTYHLQYWLEGFEGLAVGTMSTAIVLVNLISEDMSHHIHVIC